MRLQASAAKVVVFPLLRAYVMPVGVFPGGTVSSGCQDGPVTSLVGTVYGCGVCGLPSLSKGFWHFSPKTRSRCGFSRPLFSYQRSGRPARAGGAPCTQGAGAGKPRFWPESGQKHYRNIGCSGSRPSRPQDRWQGEPGLRVLRPGERRSLPELVVLWGPHGLHRSEGPLRPAHPSHNRGLRSGLV